MKPVMVTVACPSVGEANVIMKAAVEAGLAASGQTWPIKSFYRWNGETVAGEEHIVLLKTVDKCFESICQLIFSHHSYELPSIVMIPILAGGPGYVDWLLDSIDGDVKKVGASPTLKA